MKKTIYVIVTIVCIFVLLLTTAFLLTRNHLWSKISASKIYYNGIFRPDANCFVSKDGDYLIVIKDTGSDSAHYFVHSKLGKIGMEPGSQYYDLPGYIYTKDYPVNTVLSGTDKFEKYAKVKITDESIDIYFDSKRSLVVLFDSNQ